MFDISLQVKILETWRSVQIQGYPVYSGVIFHAVYVEMAIRYCGGYKKSI